MSEAPNVRLTMLNDPENVRLVREVLAGVADAVQLSDATRDDVMTAVSEACNNVVLHAYHGRRGPLQVELTAGDGDLEVLVRDRGSGMTPRVASNDDSVHGIGIAAIQTFASRAEFRSAPDEGTVVQMEFDAPGAQRRLASAAPRFVELMPEWDVRLSIAPTDLVDAILVRVVSRMAVRAGFSIDRLSDAQLLVDAVVAHLPTALTGVQVAIGLAAESHKLELQIGPLIGGGVEQLISAATVEGLDSIIEHLADDMSAVQSGSAEMVFLRMFDRPER